MRSDFFDARQPRHLRQKWQPTAKNPQAPDLCGGATPSATPSRAEPHSKQGTPCLELATTNDFAEVAGISLPFQYRGLEKPRVSARLLLQSIMATILGLLEDFARRFQFLSYEILEVIQGNSLSSEVTHKLKMLSRSMKNCPYWSIAIGLCVILLVCGPFIVPPLSGRHHRTRENSSAIIGIDLGNSYSRVSVMRGSRIEILPNKLGRFATPSRVTFLSNKPIVGEISASETPPKPSSQTVFGMLSLIGKTWDDEFVQTFRKRLPFELVNRKGFPAVSVDLDGRSETFTPEKILALIIYEMKGIAETNLGHQVTEVVIAVPSHFTFAQRDAIRRAGTLAGAEVVRTQLSAIVASYPFYPSDKYADGFFFFVYDLGGSSSEASLIRLDAGVYTLHHSINDFSFGGEAFTSRLLTRLVHLFNSKNAVNITEDDVAMMKLRNAAENAKRLLSVENTTHIQLKALFDGRDFDETITRSQFEELNADLFNKIGLQIDQLFRKLENSIDISAVRDIILVGGSALVPRVQRILEEYFQKRPLAQDGVNVDEAIVYGAGTLGRAFDGEILCKVGVWATDRTLGIETAGGIMTPMVRPGHPIPLQFSMTFSTEFHLQTEMLISVYEGESPKVKDNKLLGSFELSNIPLAPKGEPEIEVTFELEIPAMLEVVARHKKTGRFHSATFNLYESQLYTPIPTSEQAGKQYINVHRDHMGDGSTDLLIAPGSSTPNRKGIVVRNLQLVDPGLDRKLHDEL